MLLVGVLGRVVFPGWASIGRCLLVVVVGRFSSRTLTTMWCETKVDSFEISMMFPVFLVMWLVVVDQSGC